jgi:hypothetical protein
MELVKINTDRFIVLDDKGFTASAPMSEPQALHWLAEHDASGDHEAIVAQAKSDWKAQPDSN